MISKSDFVRGVRCSRLFWYSKNSELPPASLEMKFFSSQGKKFEHRVHELFPNAINLSHLSHNDEIITQTNQNLKPGKTIFEGGFFYKNLFVKVDILESVNNKWNIYEIKSSTKVKPEHKIDLGFQRYVLEKLGLVINKCFIIHVNNKYVKNGEIDNKEMIVTVDITKELPGETDIEREISDLALILKNNKAPEIELSKNCKKPGDCDNKNICWSDLPEYNVFHLNDWRKYWNLYKKGIVNIDDIPSDMEFKPKDQNILQAIRSNKPYIDIPAIKSFLDNLNFPLNHFDFETFNTVVPIFDNSSPWQQLPFQYSLHVEQENGNIAHFEFLSRDNKDPRRELLNSLKTNLGDKGDVIVYYKNFEVLRLKELVKVFPEEEEWINQVIERIVDLWDVFWDFSYYNPIQKGSTSLKNVFPALTGRSYSELNIQEGMVASIQFYESHIEEKLDNKEDIRRDLLKYCGLDTEAMILIINHLKELVKK
ncbi:MAG: hypothetical protein HeimC3_10810 [Candidatus Heimdallarchaeota archaeon LC_3]|nr:MAG: hypothetical protein HeimC3_10810 [Candidatus Heimdallarchaeota archaeon LC_3]